MGTTNRQYSHSLAIVWLVSIEVVERAMPSALKFLQLLSFLNPDNISLNFLVEGKNALEIDMEKTLMNNLKFAEILLCLEPFSLVKWSRERQTLSIHRLVQAAVKDKICPSYALGFISIAIRALSRLPEKDDAWILTFRSLLGYIKREMDQLSEAAVLLQKTLDVQKTTLGPKDSDTMLSMHNLAVDYRNQGYWLKLLNCTREHWLEG